MTYSSLSESQPASLGVIIPAYNCADLIVDCVLSIKRQLRRGDRILVVDDGSSDETASAARSAGAMTLSTGGQLGPYAARNLGVNFLADMAAYLFFDARCRAREGLIDFHLQSLGRGDVAFSCSSLEVIADDSLAAKVTRARDPFALRQYFTGPPSDWYFPTCNLAVLADRFATAGYFPQVRSGGDAKFCRSLTASSGLQPVGSERLLAGWVPRTTLKEVGDQFSRYGQSLASHDLDHRASLLTLRRARMFPFRCIKRLLECFREGYFSPTVLAGAVYVQYRYDWSYVKMLSRGKTQGRHLA